MDYKQLELTRQNIFKDAVLSLAEAKGMQLIAEAGKKHDDELEKAREQCKNSGQVLQKTSLTQEAERALSETAQAARKELLERRNTLVEAMFAKIESRLAAFTESAEYTGWLLQRLEKRTGSAPEKIAAEIFLRPADMEYAEELRQALPGSTVVPDAGIRLGGLKVRFGNILFNDTLEESLLRQREEFYASGRMRL